MQTPVMSQGAEAPPVAQPESPPKPENAPRSAPVLDLARVAQDLQIRKVQVESVVGLLDEGNTVPFITRYRKERTGGLNEEVIRQIQARVAYLRQLAERKQTILKSIEGQGKLTDELCTAIFKADTTKRLEDLYLPYKPKKRTLATIARERGLEPLALAIWTRDPVAANLAEVLPGMVNPEKELKNPEDVLLGVQHLLAEQLSETAEIRAAVRVVLWETGKLCTSKPENLPEAQGLEYKDYFQFTESVRHIPPHRILAINRGEKAGALKARLEWDAEAVRHVALAKIPLADHPQAEFLKKTAEDALTRLIVPSLEREIRRELTEEAEDHAVRVFARNLRSLLLQPPIRGRRVLAIDPGFRTGCKIAALDELGNLLEDTVIYPYSRSERGKGKAHDRAEGGKGKTEQAMSPAAASPIAQAIAAAAPPAEAFTAVVTAYGEQATAAPSPLRETAPSVSSPAEPLPAAPEPALAAAPTPVETTLPSSLLAEPAVVAPPEPTAAPSDSSFILHPSALPPGPSPREEAKTKLEELIRKHNLNVVAIGNGTACRETEELVSELIAQKLPELAYVIVNEAGASVYSTSHVGREEFPNFDATLRGTISIGRRLQDPLSELVKIDPQNNGVGLYQHDLHPRRLRESLDAVIESCVNFVGIDLNIASVPLLRHVSGLNQLAARELVDYRKQHGPFKSREQLLQVPGIGPARFIQAAGFLKVMEGDNPLDQTWVHPESYPATHKLLSELGVDLPALRDRQKTDELRTKLKAIVPEEVCSRLDLGVPTLRDICEALSRPGRDPREDLPPPIFKKGILKLEDLQPGMELKGTVLNVVDFGAFVDIGLKDSGLVHISQMANRYIKNPYDVVSVGDVVTIWVLAVDHERKRVSLSMIKPGTERRPPERKPAQPQPQQQDRRPPRGRRPPPRQGQAVAVPRQGQPVQPVATGEAAQTAAGAAAQQARPAASAPPPRPPARQHKPRREPPKPNLSRAALEGAAPLRTFSELKAFFEAQQKSQAPKPPPAEDSDKPQSS